MGLEVQKESHPYPWKELTQGHKCFLQWDYPQLWGSCGSC